MKKNKERILVTGGTGFIGSNLIRNLLELRFNITIFSTEDIENSKIEDLRERIEFLKLDLRKEKKLKDALKKVNPSVIVHLAANLDRRRDPNLIKSMMADNLETTLNLYTASLKLKTLKCIITFGSAEEYGQNKAPFNENQKEIPVSPYSLSKICINYLSSYFYRIHNLPIVIVRPFIVYGEYQTNNQFIPFVISKCLKNESIDMTKGEQTRDFIYVKDLVEAIIKIIRNPKKLLGETINICTGKEIKIKDAALIIKREANSNSKINFRVIEYREGENMHFYGSNIKAKSLLNWSPKYSFEEGIKKTIDWYKSNI